MPSRTFCSALVFRNTHRFRAWNDQACTESERTVIVPAPEAMRQRACNTQAASDR